MRNPEIFIAYAPRGAGLRCAIAYLERGADLYGWFIGPRDDAVVEACYFLLGDFRSNAPVRFEAVDQADLHTSWSLDEERRHELAQMQEAFAREWLFYRDAPDAAFQLGVYADAELAVGEVGLRFERLNKLSKLQPNWTYYSPRFDRSALRRLAGRWLLEYRPYRDKIPAHRMRAAGPRP